MKFSFTSNLRKSPQSLLGTPDAGKNQCIENCNTLLQYHPGRNALAIHVSLVIFNIQLPASLAQNVLKTRSSMKYITYMEFSVGSVSHLLAGDWAQFAHKGGVKIYKSFTALARSLWVGFDSFFSVTMVWFQKSSRFISCEVGAYDQILCLFMLTAHKKRY